ncbi:MAG: Hyaluronate lyase [Clostridia bacterium]|nr:Hyaluronate lyase [Clostridia bacterium]
MRMDKFDLWRQNWRDYLLGKAWNPESEHGKQIISSLERMADTEVEDTNDNSHIVYFSPFFKLHALTVSYCTKGTRHYADEGIKAHIFSELDHLYETEYNLSTSPENWWAVQIGLPLRVLNILILLYDELDNREEEIKKWTDTILHFQNAYSLTSRGQVEGGANLMWKCHVHYLTGILRKETEWIEKANDWLQTILVYANPVQILGHGKIYDDGFYPDGSFLQHYMFAYTGGYGKHLLNIFCGLLYAFDGTDLITLSEEKKEFFYHLIHEAYEPIIYNGRVMDFARGREVSRYFNQDNMIGRFVIRSLCYISVIMPEPEKTRTIAMLKEWLSKNDTGKDLLKDEYVRGEYYILPSLAEVYEKVLAAEIPPRGELIGHYNFGVVSKAVHLAKGFGFAVSMHSQNIACYEYLNGESSKFWHMADGVTYLYTSDADQYNQGYYATVDMQRLPGTTVDRSPDRVNDPYYNWYLPESKNVYKFAGGASLGNIGIAGMQYRGQGLSKDKSLEVKKSWFMLDHEIVCLGSGITSPTGNPIETVIDNKRLENNANVITINNEVFSLSNATIPTKTLHITGNCGETSDIGYYFPEETEVTVVREHREGTWNTVEVNPENKCENDFATFYIEHGKRPKDASYAYVILPGFTADAVREYANAPSIEILENSSSAHAIRQNSNQLLCVNFWNTEAYKAAGISSNTQCCVLVRKELNRTEIAISDPTKDDQLIELHFEFDAKEVVHKDTCIKVISLTPFSIQIDTKDKHGQSILVGVSHY